MSSQKALEGGEALTAIERHQKAERADFEAYETERIPVDNPTSIHPTEFRCLIRLDPTDDKTEGGVYIPEARQDRNQMAETEATLIEVGGRAFEDFGEPRPVVGDRVLVTKYAGETPKAGDFTDLYRICNDKEIVAVLSK